MPNEEIIALEKELKRLILEPAGSELVSVLNKLAYACLHSDPRRTEACALEARNLAEKKEDARKSGIMTVTESRSSYMFPIILTLRSVTVFAPSAC